ncbi:MAG: hypothetical protein KME17_27095 [Cyanosarcina radialis HA8281-LM2]|jgi:hypothetical protein|nr:hypothetical protein [Cyanosarcina radialis HA8281-LM2]
MPTSQELLEMSINLFLNGLKFMKVWISTFVVLFAIAELFQWLKGFTLPMPAYILGGALLAIASNYDRGDSFSFDRSDAESSPHPALTGTPLPSLEEGKEV